MVRQFKIYDKAEEPKVSFAEAGINLDNRPPLFETREIITSKNVARFSSSREYVKSVGRRLRKEGFNVLFEGSTTINIGGSKEVYESVFETKIFPVKREVRKHYRRKDDPIQSTNEGYSRGWRYRPGVVLLQVWRIFNCWGNQQILYGAGKQAIL